MNCKTTHIVYVIRCRHPNCEMQYVGQTTSSVAKRMSSHKSHIRAGTGCKVLSDHFTQVHQLSDMTITPIERLDNTLDLKGREAIEESWMKKLNTLYPYGLNVRAKTCQVMDAVNEVEGSKLSIYSKFDKVTITRRRRGRRRARSISDFNASQFISNLIDSDTPTLRSIRTGISQLNIRKVKLVYLESVNRLRNRESVWKIHLLRVVKDISLFKCRGICVL